MISIKNLTLMITNLLFFSDNYLVFLRGMCRGSFVSVMMDSGCLLKKIVGQRFRKGPFEATVRYHSHLYLDIARIHNKVSSSYGFSVIESRTEMLSMIERKSWMKRFHLEYGIHH